MTTYTTSLRLAQMTPGDSAVRNSWGSVLNTNFALLENAICGVITVSLNGLTSYSLSTANGATDQARTQAIIFTGLLNADCTVTIPSVVKTGWILNNTSGGKNVILSQGGGTTVTAKPDTFWRFFICDGSNVYVPSQHIDTLDATNLTVSGSFSTPSSSTVVSSLGFQATGQDSGGANYRARQGSYGSFLRNDGLNTYLLQTSSGNQNGTFNSFRPFSWRHSDGLVTIDGTNAGVQMCNNQFTVGSGGIDNIGSSTEGWHVANGVLAGYTANGHGTSLQICNATASTALFLTFFTSVSNSVGSITSNGSSTSYNTTSDYRLKELHGPASGDLIDGIKVHDASFKKRPDVRYPMVVAHELSEVAPWAVHGTKDAVDPQGVPLMQQVDYSKLVAALIAKVQELSARVAALESPCPQSG